MSEKLEIYPIRNSMLNDAIDRVLVKLHAEKKNNNTNSFLFTGASANGGTTTVAINIAIALAEAGWKTVFVDCDFRKSQKYKRVVEAKGASLSEYLTGLVSDYKSTIKSTNVNNLDYVLSGEKNDNPVRLLCNSHFESFFNYLKSKYDFVILDTPPVSAANDAEILIPLIDKYLFVVCMNDTKKRQLVNSRIQLANYEDKFMGIIVNRVEKIQYKDEFKDYDYFTKNNLQKKQAMGIRRKAVEEK